MKISMSDNNNPDIGRCPEITPAMTRVSNRFYRAIGWGSDEFVVEFCFYIEFKTTEGFLVHSMLLISFSGLVKKNNKGQEEKEVDIIQYGNLIQML